MTEGQSTLDGSVRAGDRARDPAPHCDGAHAWKARADGSLRCRRCGIALPGGTDWAAMAWYADVVRPRARDARRAMWREVEG